MSVVGKNLCPLHAVKGLIVIIERESSDPSGCTTYTLSKEVSTAKVRILNQYGYFYD
jgi:hypothetical protein